MKKFSNITARCIAASDSVSILVDEDTQERCVVNNDDIEKFVELPPDILEGGHFRVGADVALCGIFYGNGKVKWVPDQKVYPRKEATSYISLGEENSSTEFKRSLIHIADRDLDNPVMGNKPAQYKIIAKEIAGMVTAKSPNAQVIIGCDDNGCPLGLNNEVGNKNAAESDLRNYLSQCFGNISFVSRIQMKWEEIEGRLILRILIPEYHGDILLVGQTEVYYRNGSNTTRVKGTELINLIRNYNS